MRARKVFGVIGPREGELAGFLQQRRRICHSNLHRHDLQFAAVSRFRMIGIRLPFFCVVRWEAAT